MFDNDVSNQVIVVTGARGVGKTLFSGTFAKPSKIGRVYWHDSEHSANNFIANLTAQNLTLGRYVDLGSQFSNLPDDDDLLKRIDSGKLPWVDNVAKSSLVNYYKFIIDDINNNLIRGQYDVYIHDTIEKLEAGMAAWVEENKKQAGVSTIAFGKLWTEGVYPLYEQLIASIFSRGVKTIILTSHLKTPWEGNRPVVGKVVPSGKKILYYLSRLMIWLVKEPTNADGAPAGLILKERMASVNADNDEWNIKRMLPARIPHCTWKDIRRYLRDGCDVSNPKPGEFPSDDEREMMSELISNKQMELMILDAKRSLMGEEKASSLFVEQELSPVDELTQKIVAISQSENTKVASVIKQKLSEAGIEASLPQIMKALQ